MRDKLFRSYFTASMLSFLMCLAVVLGLMYQNSVSEHKVELREEAGYISTLIQYNGVEVLQSIDRPDDTQITVIVSVEADLGGETNPADTTDAEDIQMAIVSGEGYSTNFAERTINYAKKLDDGSILRISKQQNSLMHIVASSILPIMLSIVAAMAFSSVSAIKTAAKITEPINKINLEAPDDRDVYEEIKPLVRRITAQNKQIHMQMEQQKKEHATRDLHRREFTANVSHELKTPLTSISGFAEIIRDGLVRTEDIQRFADNIYKEAQRLIVLVEDIIHLSMVEDKEIKAAKTDVDMYDICEQVINTLASTAEKRGITFELNGEPAVVCGVHSILDEIVYNLCDNAVKYNKDGGKVTVSVTDGKTDVSVRVADTGIGIPEEDIDRVFERFYRVDKSHSREIGGTGLGLSIVKHGVEYHNGAISIESTFGQGTVITVKFQKG